MAVPHIKPSHKGLLHEDLGIPQGKNISVHELMVAGERAHRTGSAKLARRVNFAKNARKWHHS